MDVSDKKGFKFSLFLHGSVLVLLLFISLIQMCKRTPPAHVFTLASPTPAPIQKTIELAQPAKQDPKPEQKKEVKPTPAAKQMSYAEFVKKQGKPKKKKTRTQPRKVTPIKTVNISKFQNELEQIIRSSTTHTAAQTTSSPPSYNEISAYNQRLKAKIDSVYQKPAGSNNTDLAAVVQFSVAPNGNIFDVKIVKSSGSEVFDGSVKQAFAKVNNAGRPPGGQGGTYQITFRFRD